MRPSRVWYLAYGSNVNPDRFRLYLEGGTTEAGARDRTPPARSVFVRVPVRLRFALESTRWNGGGVAFVSPSDDAERWAWARAWDITAEQFEDVFAQENRGSIGTELPWQALLAATSLDVGERWYRRILRFDLAELEALAPGQPAMTFTWASEAPLNPPGPEYRGTIARGLADHPELDAEAIDAYLDASTLAP